MYKILHVTNSLGTGGAERLIADLAGLLDKDKFHMNVCCTGPDGRTRAALEEAGSRVTVLNRRRRSSVLFPLFCADVIALFQDINAVIKRERPDLVHTHLEANYIAPFCARYAGVKAVVSSFHSSVLLAPRGRWSVRNAARRAMLRRVARTADALVAGSEFAARAVAELCGVDPGAVDVVRNAVDVSRVEREKPHDRLREELGLAPGERLVVTLGTVKEPKNHRLLVEAIALVNRRLAQRRAGARVGGRDDLAQRPDVAGGRAGLAGRQQGVAGRRDVPAGGAWDLGEPPGVSAVIVGAGRSGFVLGLRDLAARLGLEGKVHFLGYREDAYSIVRACDLMVLPSLWEGLPVAALEGMACGLPVLLSDIAPHRELVEDGLEGWLFRSNDKDSLAESILRVMEDDEAMAVVARAGYRKVREHYDSTQMARSCERLYERCIRGAG